jgi:phosphate starvation-inducible PhoH-like protein
MSKKSRGKKPEVFDLADIQPLTENQAKAFKSNKSLILSGSAGTGKSFLACYFACESMIKRKKDNIVLIRSAVPTRDLGFLPGNDKEKARIYEEPYYDIFSEILGRGDAYEILKKKESLEFMTTSYMRGLTLRDSTIFIDECQNMTFHELDSIITRVGENCRIIFCGDFKQADLKKNGLLKFITVLSRMDQDFDHIEFTVDDIVRSEFVKRYLKTKEAYESSTIE